MHIKEIIPAEDLTLILEALHQLKRTEQNKLKREASPAIMQCRRINVANISKLEIRLTELESQENATTQKTFDEQAP